MFLYLGFFPTGFGNSGLVLWDEVKKWAKLSKADLPDVAKLQRELMDKEWPNQRGKLDEYQFVREKREQIIESVERGPEAMKLISGRMFPVTEDQKRRAKEEQEAATAEKEAAKEEQRRQEQHLREHREARMRWQQWEGRQRQEGKAQRAQQRQESQFQYELQQQQQLQYQQQQQLQFQQEQQLQQLQHQQQQQLLHQQQQLQQHQLQQQYQQQQLQERLIANKKSKTSPSRPRPWTCPRA
jgi:hypothetical protein